MKLKRSPATLWSLRVCGFQLAPASPSTPCQKIIQKRDYAMMRSDVSPFQKRIYHLTNCSINFLKVKRLEYELECMFNFHM